VSDAAVTEPPLDPHAWLRAKLLDLRAALLARLLEGELPTPGFLALFADVDRVFAAVDATMSCSHAQIGNEAEPNFDKCCAYLHSSAAHEPQETGVSPIPSPAEPQKAMQSDAPSPPTSIRSDAQGTAHRAVLQDDGRAIRLVLFYGAAALGIAALDPVSAIGLAGELLAAAHRRLADPAVTR
jgi:hypothetical protein